MCVWWCRGALSLRGFRGSDTGLSLSLSANGIGPAGGVQLVESLALCKHLEELM